MDTSAQVFSLHGILPASTSLAFDPLARIALLLYLDPGAPALVLRAVALPPSAAGILLALLHAYPDPCPYRGG